jgi:hypothetical protein
MYLIAPFAMLMMPCVQGITLPMASIAQTKKFKVISIPYSEAVRRLMLNPAAVPYREVDGPKNFTNLPPDHSIGDLLAYETVSPENSNLFVFIPGSWASCGEYSKLLEYVATTMYTLCLPYDNIESIADICQGKSEDCFLKTRRLAYDGDFAQVKDNNQHDRLVSALQFLDKFNLDNCKTDKCAAQWGQYLSGGQPVWNEMIVGGHSQGAGSAALIAYTNEVARVVQFSGVCDQSNWTLAQSKTKSTRFYGLGHQSDLVCGHFPRHWKNEGATKLHEPLEMTAQAAKDHTFKSTLKEAKRQGVQTVISTIPFTCPSHEPRTVNHVPILKQNQCALAGHESIACDRYWEKDPNPYITEGVWDFVIGLKEFAEQEDNSGM